MSIGKIIGAAVFAGATAAIWLWPEAKAPEPPAESVRPIRSYVVGEKSIMPELRFVGRIKAGASRTLAFKQAGRVQRIPVASGQTVKKGEKLAWLFADDFKNRLEEATAAAERDRLSFKRISEAAAKNAVSKEELSRAEAELRKSEANLELARRALAETEIIAPFDGMIASVPGTELNMVGSNDKIVVLQDISKIKIDVAVPETIVILQPHMSYVGGDDCILDVEFDSLPGRKFHARFLEYVAAADAESQTYTATYQMEPVEDLLLLPGMSASVIVPAGHYSLDGGAVGLTGVDIPEAAVGVDGQGGYFVWKLERDGETFLAHKTPISDCFAKGERMSVGSGLKPGDRIATAGVSVLTENRRVRLMED